MYELLDFIPARRSQRRHFVGSIPRNFRTVGWAAGIVDTAAADMADSRPVDIHAVDSLVDSKPFLLFLSLYRPFEITKSVGFVLRSRSCTNLDICNPMTLQRGQGLCLTFESRQ